MSVFRLRDASLNGYRWARVNMSLDGLAPKEYLQVASKARQDLHAHMQTITTIDQLERADRFQPA